MFRLTASVAEEVGGLLGVCADEAATSGDCVPWGHVDGAGYLTVTNAAEAVIDLTDRADYLIDEGERVGSTAGLADAKGLRRLAKRIKVTMKETTT